MKTLLALHRQAQHAHRVARRRVLLRNQEVKRLVETGEATLPEIAAQLGVTRARVSHMLKAARRDED